MTRRGKGKSKFSEAQARTWKSFCTWQYISDGQRFLLFGSAAVASKETNSTQQVLQLSIDEYRLCLGQVVILSYATTLSPILSFHYHLQNTGKRMKRFLISYWSQVQEFPVFSVVNIFEAKNSSVWIVIMLLFFLAIGNIWKKVVAVVFLSENFRAERFGE